LFLNINDSACNPYIKLYGQNNGTYTEHSLYEEAMYTHSDTGLNASWDIWFWSDGGYRKNLFYFGLEYGGLLSSFNWEQVQAPFHPYSQDVLKNVEQY